MLHSYQPLNLTQTHYFDLLFCGYIILSRDTINNHPSKILLQLIFFFLKMSKYFPKSVHVSHLHEARWLSTKLRLFDSIKNQQLPRRPDLSVMLRSMYFHTEKMDTRFERLKFDLRFCSSKTRLFANKIRVCQKLTFLAILNGLPYKIYSLKTLLRQLVSGMVISISHINRIHSFNNRL